MSETEITPLDEIPRIIRAQTTCGACQYMNAPPQIVMATFTLPAGFHPTLQDPSGRPIPQARQFGFVGQSQMTGEDGEKLIVLNYLEGHVPQKPKVSLHG